MMRNIAFIFLAALLSISFAEGCPPGASDCFLCGGIDGIPCYAGPDCTGVWSVAAQMNIACECPQGEPCICYCPYSAYSGQEPGPSAPPGCPPECTHGCSTDGVICAKMDASEIEGKGAVRISAFTGNVFVKKPGGDWARVTGKLTLDRDYDVLVMDGEATLIYGDGCRFVVDENTRFRTHQFMFVDGRSTLEIIVELVHGAIKADVTARDGTKFEVSTPVSVMGVKGTRFYISHDPLTMTDTIIVYEGEVEVESSSGTLTLSEGQTVQVTDSGAGTPSYFESGPAESPEVSVEREGCCAPAFALLLSLAGLFAIHRQT